MGQVEDHKREIDARLLELDPAARSAFAATCAERLLCASESLLIIANAVAFRVLREALDRIWTALGGSEQLAAIQALDQVLQLIPNQDDSQWGEAHARADDASSAIAYALRTLVSAAPRDAAWAAARNFDAIFELSRSRHGIRDDRWRTEYEQAAADEIQRQKQDILALAR